MRMSPTWSVRGAGGTAALLAQLASWGNEPRSPALAAGEPLDDHWRVASDEQAIAALIHLYAERLDDGDLDGVAALFADATWRTPARADALRGHVAVRRAYDGVILHDGRPGTKHVITQRPQSGYSRSWGTMGGSQGHGDCGAISTSICVDGGRTVRAAGSRLQSLRQGGNECEIRG